MKNAGEHGIPSVDSPSSETKKGENTSISLSRTVVGGSSRRSDYPLCRATTALVVIDVQEYLSRADTNEKNTYLYEESLPKAVPNIRRLLDSFRSIRDGAADSRKYGSEVIFTYLEALTANCRDVSLDYKLSGPKLAELPGPLLPAKFLPEIHPSTSIGRGDILIPKTSCSVFNSTNLNYILRNLQIEQVVLCGQLTDQCVESAARDAADLGYFVTVAEDACAATGMSEHSKGLSGMKGFARIMPSQQVLEEMNAAPAPLAAPSNGVDFCDVDASIPDKSYSETGHSSQNEMKCTSPETQILVKRVADWSPPKDVSLSGASIALLRALRCAGVEFLRLAVVDAVGSIRCKATPIDYVIGKGGGFDGLVSIAEACVAGMATYADLIIPRTNTNAKNVLTVKPDLNTLRILPYAEKSALVLGTLHHQRSGELSPLCTRGLLARVLDTAADDHGLVFTVGAELEFCLFHDSSDSSKEQPLQAVDESLFGHPRTLNQQECFISDLHRQLKKQDIEVELIHAESASGQLEIVLKYQTDTLKLADDILFARETIGACAKSHCMRAIFLPKVKHDQAGNGMHLHVSFRNLRASNPEKNAFQHDSNPGSISPLGKSFIEGILAHLPALTSVTIPSTNSYCRVGPGCWTGHSVGWSIEDKEAPLRVCLDLKTGAATNVEYKLSDSTANIYLELALLLAAGMQGVSQSLSLRPMSNADEKQPSLPKSFGESLDCLRNNKFLLSIMGSELSTAYLAIREAEKEKFSGQSLEDALTSAYSRA